MHEYFQPIVTELSQIAEALRTSIPNNSPLSINSANWSFPGVTRSELLARAVGLQEVVQKTTLIPSEESEALLKAIAERLAFLAVNTVPQIAAQAHNAVPAYLITMDAVEKALAPVLEDPKALAIKNAQALKKSTTQVRGMETRLRDLSPRMTSLEEMVNRIEKAHEAADQLPTDLETLAESQKKVSDLFSKAEVDKAAITNTRESVATLEAEMKEREAEAKRILAQCESAYSSATSLGLAAAFSERSNVLSKSMWVWVIGLILALIFGGYYGAGQLQSLSRLISNPDATTGLVSLNLALAAISVGAPIWFAWLSTKQVGQRFRLSEDYAFKASISRAYEGYRKEAARIDPNLEAQLLASALSRLDEQPLRLVESASYGSPWHELLASDAIKDAARSVPGFVDSVAKFASDSLNRVKPKVVPPTPLSPSSTPKPEVEEDEK